MCVTFLASRSERAGVENAEALPNPWGNRSGTGTGNQNQQGSQGSQTGSTGGSQTNQQQPPAGNNMAGMQGKTVNKTSVLYKWKSWHSESAIRFLETVKQTKRICSPFCLCQDI